MTVLCRTCCKNIRTDEKSFQLDSVLTESDNTESLHRILKSLFPTVVITIIKNFLNETLNLYL